MTSVLLPWLLALAAPAHALSPVDAQAILQIEAQRLPAGALDSFLTHEDAATRARAATALGRLRTADAIESLTALKRDDSLEVQLATAFALGQTPGTERIVYEWLSDAQAPELRVVLINALGKQADRMGARPFLDLLDQRTAFLQAPKEAEAAALALGRLALRDRDAVARQDVIAALLTQLDRRDSATRRAAAFALARARPSQLDRPLADTLLHAATTEADAPAQAFLVRAIADLAVPASAVAAVLEHTARDPDRGVRIATARTAAVCGWTGVAGMVADPNPRVRAAAIAAVGSVAALDRVALLMPIVEAGDTIDAAEDLRAGTDTRLLDAAAALGGLAAADLVPDLSPWLDAARPTPIRVAAVSGVSLKSRLVRLATDDAESEVRVAAALRLSQLDPTAADLLPLLSATDWMVAAVAAEALSLSPEALADSADTRAALLEATAQATPDQADLIAYGLSAIAALADHQDKPPIDGAIAIASTHQGHPHSRVRQAAARVLEAAGEDAPPPWHHILTVPLTEVEAITSARVVTDEGELIIDLAPELAPLTVWNFARLAEDGTFDNVPFHRIVADFVVQTGDPRGDGTGGPAWTVPDEINPLSYDEGVVGMAHAGPDTAGSQWFVTLSPQPHLDGGYTAFGRVTRGLHLLQGVGPHTRVRSVTIERLPLEL